MCRKARASSGVITSLSMARMSCAALATSGALVLTHLIRDFAGVYGHVQIASMPDRHEPDHGEIDYRWIFRLLEEVGYQGYIGCEYNPRGRTASGLAWFKVYEYAQHS